MGSDIACEIARESARENGRDGPRAKRAIRRRLSLRYGHGRACSQTSRFDSMPRSDATRAGRLGAPRRGSVRDRLRAFRSIGRARARVDPERAAGASDGFGALERVPRRAPRARRRLRVARVGDLHLRRREAGRAHARGVRLSKVRLSKWRVPLRPIRQRRLSISTPSEGKTPDGGPPYSGVPAAFRPRSFSARRRDRSPRPRRSRARRPAR